MINQIAKSAGEPPLSKGERTAQRILDAAEELFARKGFEGTSLREIASEVGIREPGLYNHFSGKREIYEAVLDRGLTPLLEVMRSHMQHADGVQAYARLPELMTDLLLDHPAMAGLFQQALQGDPESTGNQIVSEWLDRLFQQGLALTELLGYENLEREDLAVQIIAMFNLCTGYFLADRAFASLAQGSVTDPANIERQKKLLRKLQRAIMLG